jgi:hypothetical protein
MTRPSRATRWTSACCSRATTARRVIDLRGIVGVDRGEHERRRIRIARSGQRRVLGLRRGRLGWQRVGNDRLRHHRLGDDWCGRFARTRLAQRRRHLWAGIGGGAGRRGVHGVHAHGVPRSEHRVTVNPHRERQEDAMPQRAWSDKRERQYEHIKDGLLDRGEDEDTAEEIAARTVNKERARSGEAKTASRSSTDDISSGRRGGLRSHDGPGGRTYAQLYNEARQRNLQGRSSMNKAQLERALRR